MKLFVQEFATSGGLSETPLSADLLVEGFGMLRTLITYYQHQGVHISTTIDKRLNFLEQYLPAEKLETISSQNDFLKQSLRLVSEADAFLVVAPETGGCLQELVKRYEQTGTQSLNCTPATIELASEKSRLYALCAQWGIPIPKTVVISKKQTLKSIHKEGKILAIDIQTECNFKSIFGFNFPMIIKPNDGVACTGVRILRTKEELLTALKERVGTEQLVQEYLEGEDLSVTAFVWKGEIYFLSLNKQILSLGVEKSEYLGGITNYKHPQKEEIFAFCRGILEQIPALSGFVGIDLIARKETDSSWNYYFIEVNPRVTTPICGFLDNVAESFSLPPIETSPRKSRNLEQKKTTYFAKAKFNFPLKTDHPLYLAFQTEAEIITPPLCFNDTTVYTLVRSSGKNVRKATANFDKRLAYIANKLKQEFL